jgi:hypothetical protein
MKSFQAMRPVFSRASWFVAGFLCSVAIISVVSAALHESVVTHRHEAPPESVRRFLALYSITQMLQVTDMVVPDSGQLKHLASEANMQAHCALHEVLPEQQDWLELFIPPEMLVDEFHEAFLMQEEELSCATLDAQLDWLAKEVMVARFHLRLRDLGIIGCANTGSTMCPIAKLALTQQVCL